MIDHVAIAREVGVHETLNAVQRRQEWQFSHGQLRAYTARVLTEAINAVDSMDAHFSETATLLQAIEVIRALLPADKEQKQ